MLGFAELQNLHRRAVRSEVNPMDKCTLVSIYPKDIHERKLTISPGDFYIPAGSYETPSLLVVGPSSWWKDTGPDDPLIEISMNSAVVAQSICQDWMNGMLGCNMNDAKPGLFWLPGEIKAEELKSNLKYKNALDTANVQQKKYYSSLILMADSLWARSNGNPLAIPGDSKLAAEKLGLDKEWMRHVTISQAVRCIACGNMRAPQFPVCPHCKMVVDPEKAQKLGLKFAE